MKYCQSCGTGHECDAEETGREKAEVAVVRLQTQRDIEVARINAQAEVKVAASDAATIAAHAEGVVEGAGAIIDAATPDPVEPAGAPIVVQADTPAPDLADEPDLTPPEVVTPVAAGKSDGGWWGSYR